MRRFSIAFVLSFIAFSILSNSYAQNLPTQTSTLFSGSGNCASCHTPGGSNKNALRSPQGDDISPQVLWRSTMMANAFRDPFWQAKVSAEINTHPQYQQIIEDKCTTCHAPLGRTEAIYHGAQYYSLNHAITDPLANDGVSCTLCHQIDADNLGTPESFSGHYHIENVHLIYGPYQNPFGNPMQMMSGYTPVFGEHVDRSELCATCHTLFTPTVDNDGNIIGEAPEQTPYLEWKNSKFPTVYPSRRAWLYLNLNDNNGQPVFRSGDWMVDNGEIKNLDSPYETHHDVITSSEQVQVYQAIMKDVDGNVNYTLLRAAGYIKDNRIPPEGFTSNGPDYESTTVEGLARQDFNFNRQNGSEGSGVDTVTYKISGLGTTKSYQLKVKLLYQTLSPRFVADLFQYSTHEVEEFKGYYQNMTNSPITIDSLALSINATGIDLMADNVPQSPVVVRAYPNPFNPMTTIQYKIPENKSVIINIFDINGKLVCSLVNETKSGDSYSVKWDGKNSNGVRVTNGVYFYRMISDKYSCTKKLILIE